MYDGLYIWSHRPTKMIKLYIYGGLHIYVVTDQLTTLVKLYMYGGLYICSHQPTDKND